ncbi:unnamed protein product [Arabidopsis lyrata]|uniref:uncharacterized protein LOC9303528 n=1 Tax=Arabidopsis lyrata subsp. lyrata TaxID=81972 RepID=UPI000A29D933|nr:uncharacterized protein LOC9303528 [Arabidopsis lyrata subsp. lyrata]CAH8275067.1 unnamed protein product [Arabidopsis lyrata]|eukprot:XP_020875117.1 uncharacterized protein LOC9303528 [Arabidopsis lyrata subsp. lyrata]
MMTPVKKNVSIRPVTFYGNGLPRPRFFDNPKFNAYRVDPPVSVLDPLLSWARDAHWSMGGLNFTRLRLQGRIEGNVNKLRAQLEKSSPVKLESGISERKKKKRSGSESPPAAPIVLKRRRYLDLNDSDDDEEVGSEDEGVVRIRRKLSDDFDRVAGESMTKLVEANKKSIKSELVEKTRLKEKKKKIDKLNKTSSMRSSPRLAKRSSS